MKNSSLVFLLTLLVNFSFAQQKQSPAVIKTFHISSNGGWDYIKQHDGKLYVSHGTQVNILDENTGDSVGYISHTGGVHGIAFDDHLGRGYTSNGRQNNVTVFDLKTNDTLARIATGENPDAIMFEPYTKTIITCNARSNSLSVIDPKENKVIATITLSGNPEEAVSDGKGKLFVNIENKSEIAEIDLKKYTVLHRWSLAPAEGPTGLAYDKKTHRLFTGCDKQLVVVNADNGKIVDKVKIGDGCDGVVFDNKTKLIYTSNGEGTLSVIKEEAANKYKLVGNYPTKKGARTIAINEDTHTIYLPTAEFESGTEPNGRRKMKPGSFQVLVVQ